MDTALGDHASALAALETAIELNPSFALAHYGHAMALTLLGRTTEAIPEFELAARLSPRDPYLYAFQVVHSAALNVEGRFEEGEECARQAARHPNAGFWAYAHLAQALAGQGRAADAQKAVEKLLELRPDFSRIYFEKLWPNCDASFLRAYIELLEKARLRIEDEMRDQQMVFRDHIL